MCGLFGIYPKAGADPLSLRILALFLAVGNVNRGRHSFGAWGGGITPFRVTGAITDAENAIQFRQLVFETWNPEPGRWLAGHTRHATHGAQTLENTHPFQVRNLTLAHNGVVSVEGYTIKDHVVDSGQIALAIADHGWVPGLAKVSGSCALITSIDDHLYLYRHSQVLHLVEGDWGWAVSSQKNTLEEACSIAGLVPSSKIVEIPEDIVLAPWENVAEAAPAKKYAYQTTTPKSAAYYGGAWDGWDYEGERYGESCGRNTSMGLVSQSASGKADDDAKTKHLKTKAEMESEAKRNSMASGIIERSALMLLTIGGCSPNGPIKFDKGSRIRAKILEWAVECRRFDTIYTFLPDPDTTLTFQHIIGIKIKRSIYDRMSDEGKTSAWSKFYAKVLTSIGVTTDEFMEAYDAYVDRLQREYVKCDWCNDLVDTEDVKDFNFGLDNIRVCKHCESDFKKQRKSLDFRSNRSAARDERRKVASTRKGNA